MMKIVAAHSRDNITSVETEILLCCANTEPSSANLARIRDLAKHNINWDSLIKQAATHCVLPLLYWNLSKIIPDQIPDTVLVALRQYFQRNTFQNLKQTSELLCILEALKKSDILAIPFKGPALTLLAYENLSLRTFSDLDILVQWKHYLKAMDVLTAHGYQPTLHPFLWNDDRERELSYYRQIGAHVFIHPDRQIQIDLHGHITNSFLSQSFNCFWSRLDRIFISKNEALTFCREDLLIYLCVHGTKDCWSTLREVCDVAELVRHSSDLNWNLLLQESSRLGVKRMLIAGLFLAHQTLKLHLPKDIEDELDREARYLVNCFYRYLTQQDPVPISRFKKFWFHLIAMNRSVEQLKYCFRYLTNPFVTLTRLNRKDQLFVELPERLYLLYYFVRPLRGVREHGFRLLSILVRSFSC